MSNFQKNSKDYGEPNITYQLAALSNARSASQWVTINIKNAFMKKRITIFLVLIQMTILGVAQTPKDSCSIPKDSLCQERIAKSDTTNCPLDKLFLLKANVTNKEESRSNLPKIALPKNDIYREKFMNLQLINIIGSHLSR